MTWLIFGGVAFVVLTGVIFFFVFRKGKVLETTRFYERTPVAAGRLHMRRILKAIQPLVERERLHASNPLEHVYQGGRWDLASIAFYDKTNSTEMFIIIVETKEGEAGRDVEVSFHTIRGRSADDPRIWEGEKAVSQAVAELPSLAEEAVKAARHSGIIA